ncbi:hypothetical protein GCM10022206_95070 [Streptomyces chiangmaiensis]
MNRVRAKLALFVADVFSAVPRKDQRSKGDCCLRGLMMDGRRTSIQAMASRLPDGNERAGAVREGRGTLDVTGWNTAAGEMNTALEEFIRLAQETIAVD